MRTRGVGGRKNASERREMITGTPKNLGRKKKKSVLRREMGKTGINRENYTKKKRAAKKKSGSNRSA